MGEFAKFVPFVAVVFALFMVALCYKLLLRAFGVVIIPQDRIGVVNKKFVVVGKNRTLPDGAIIALNGEAGYQADTLPPGLHFGFWPWQYIIEQHQFVTIDEDTIGVVESRDGKSLSGGRVLAREVECDSFQDARSFLEKSGERGPQLAIIPPGTYRINSSLFTISPVPVTNIPDNMVGVVTTKEGASLPTGEIAGKEVKSHNSFQSAQTFINNGGFKGLQEQVILAGRYYINPLFAKVEMKEMTQVPIAHAGVVIAYVGAPGVDVTGTTFKHGNLVSQGQKGVWAEPLDPGKYPINPLTHRVENVPTANVVLNWATGKSESHKLDEKLSTIKVRSSDGFDFTLDVSQIIHIPRNDAPKVIARFGTVISLVSQVLEPTIGNYFRNAAQGSDAISFLKERQKRQSEACTAIRGALDEYNVYAVDTLIGDINPPADLMKTLTDRKIAEQQQVTFGTQQAAEEARKALEQAKAIAATQAKVVDAERTVSIAEFAASAAVATADGEARAAVKKAEGQADARKLEAQGQATYTKTVGAAEATKIKAIGLAASEVIKLKINSMEAGNYAAIEVADRLAKSPHKWVPEVVAGGGGDKGGMVDVLLANLVLNGSRNGHATPIVVTPVAAITTTKG